MINRIAQRKRTYRKHLGVVSLDLHWNIRERRQQTRQSEQDPQQQQFQDGMDCERNNDNGKYGAVSTIQATATGAATKQQSYAEVNSSV